jgi:uncharacterized protein (TIGR02246 family)
MRWTGVVLLVIGFTCAGFVAGRWVRHDTGSGRIASPDLKRAIEEVTTKIDEAWDAGDARAFAANWTDDAIVVDPMGELTRGRAAIEKDMASQFAGPMKGTTHQLDVQRVHSVSPSVAVADGTAAVKAPGNAEPWTANFTAVFKQRPDGDWAVSDMRSYSFLRRSS